MNKFAIGFGVFVLFIEAMSGYDFSLSSITANICGLSLILTGMKTIKKNYPTLPFYFAVVSLISFSLLILQDITLAQNFDWQRVAINLIFIILIILLIKHHIPEKKIEIKKNWSWSEGHVDTQSEYIELRYGKIENGAYNDWLPVAYISAPKDQVFHVQFLNQASDEQQKGVLEVVKKELSFYLIDKGEPDPWNYAKYHCGTTANVYGDVHWSFFPKGWTTQ